MYAASKAFVLQLSKSLNSEYRKKGIIVQVHVPGVVVTDIIHRFDPDMKVSFFNPSPDVYVRASIRQIGQEAVS